MALSHPQESSKAIAAIIEGIGCVIPLVALRLFSAEELETMVCGKATIDIRKSCLVSILTLPTVTIPQLWPCVCVCGCVCVRVAVCVAVCGCVCHHCPRDMSCWQRCFGSTQSMVAALRKGHHWRSCSGTFSAA